MQIHESEKFAEPISCFCASLSTFIPTFPLTAESLSKMLLAVAQQALPPRPDVISLSRPYVQNESVATSPPLVRRGGRSSSVGSESSILPPGAVDTHVHIFDPSLGPYAASRAYTPASATLDQLCCFNKQISDRRRSTNFVLVQPSPYGTDNRVLESILRESQDPKAFVRGIAVVDIDKVEDEELQRLHELGVRGLRLNMQAHGRGFDISELKGLMERAAARIQHLPNWKLQLYAPARVWEDLYFTIVNLPVVVIADHTGGILASSRLPVDSPRDPTLQPGFSSLVALAKEQRLLIKISGLYRSSLDVATNHADMAPIIKELARQVPDSLIWGTDWPHTGDGKDRIKYKNVNAVEPFRMVDNVGILHQIRQWMGNERNWTKLMVDNPRMAFP